MNNQNCLKEFLCTCVVVFYFIFCFLYLHWRLIQFPFAVYMNLYLAPLFLLLISVILSIQNNPIMALFPDATSRGHNKGQNSTKKTINFIMLQKHIQWNFFEDGASKVQRSEARFITYSLEFRILLERCSQNHYFIGLNEDIFGMDYPTGNFLYISILDRNTQRHDKNCRSERSGILYVYNWIIIAHDFVPLWLFTSKRLSSLF